MFFYFGGIAAYVFRLCAGGAFEKPQPSICPKAKYTVNCSAFNVKPHLHKTDVSCKCRYLLVYLSIFLSLSRRSEIFVHVDFQLVNGNVLRTESIKTRL